MNYYSDGMFLKIDLKLISLYLFNSPFQVSKEFLDSKKAQDLYTYGETPLTTLEFIANQCQLSFKDTIFELGCGRGRACFWLNHFIGCRVVGIDCIPTFIERANSVKISCHVADIEFRLESILQTDFSQATVLYLYGTCYTTAFIKKLLSHLKHLPKGTKIITVSYPLIDYQTDPDFQLIKQFSAPFTWGNADVYLQIKQ
jgi:SAM-dependent methyltransferase